MTSALCVKAGMTLQLLLLGDVTVAQLVERARLAEASGYGVVWVADERFYREVYSCLGQLAAHTSRVLLGPCVTDPFARHPALTAMAIATLDEISGGRAILGIGAGISGFAELGIDRRKPARAIGEAIELISRLLRGETVDFRGDVIAFDHGRLSFPPIRPEIPIYVASNGPLGQRMAAELADGVIMEACASAAEIRAFRAAVESAARKAGRDPQAIRIIPRLNTCIAADGRAARDAVRPTVARYLGAGALAIGHRRGPGTHPSGRSLGDRRRSVLRRWGDTLSAAAAADHRPPRRRFHPGRHRRRGGRARDRIA